MQKKILIVFDIDGTLTDSIAQHQSAFIETIQEIGVRELKEELRSFKHHTDSYISKTIYELALEEPFTEDKKKQFQLGLSKRLKTQTFTEINGAYELIQMLKQEPEIGFCFATGSLRDPAIEKLKSIGIEFESWQLVACDTLYEREHIVQQAIENATREYKVSAFEKIMSIGDGIWDLITAQNLNIDFIGVGETHKNTLLENGAKMHCKDMVALKEILQNKYKIS